MKSTKDEIKKLLGMSDLKIRTMYQIDF